MMKLEYVKVASYKKDCSCPHNEAVVCNRRTCKRCGWNPDVEKARMEKIQQERKEALE